MNGTSPPFALGLAIAVACIAVSVNAQAPKLPNPSRTVFKCQVAGKVVYSDDPCLGAQRIDVQPTRGLDKSSGRQKSGADVDREKNPWGLAIDCFGAERPARLDAKVVDVAKTGRTLAEVRTDAFAAAVPVAFTPAGPGTGTGCRVGCGLGRITG